MCAKDSRTDLKPVGLSFEQAAAMPPAANTALIGLRDMAGLRAGWSVLVNGASGGVGTFAIQIAKAYGAEVTAVRGARNVELVGSLGADQVNVELVGSLGADQVNVELVGSLGADQVVDYTRGTSPVPDAATTS